MKGHLGAALTTAIAAVAVALALFQAAVVTHGARKPAAATAIRTGPSNRYSAPGGRSGIPWVPVNKVPDKPAPMPEDREGRSPPRRQQDEHRAPPPSRFRGTLPRPGPQPVRKATA
jgi:hypothetical protein